jgi:cytochrome b
MQIVKVWDPVVRWSHWFILAVVVINTAILDEGKIHELLGYGAAIVLSIRVLWGFVGTRHARFSSFFPTKSRLKRHLGRQPDDADISLGHNPLGALMVFNLMLTLCAIMLSGHLMTTTYFWGSEAIEEIHEFFVNYLLISAGIHVAGVLFESLRSGVNLISAMVTGNKKLR